MYVQEGGINPNGLMNQINSAIRQALLDDRMWRYA